MSKRNSDRLGPAPKGIVVVDAGAGSEEAVNILFSGLSPGLNIPLLVLFNETPVEVAACYDGFNRSLGSIRTSKATAGQSLENGQIYLMDSCCGLSLDNKGFFVPSSRKPGTLSDAVFINAGECYGTGAIGVILSGKNTGSVEGAAGLLRNGGKCIVQDPSESQFPQRPLFILKQVAADYVLDASLIGYILAGLVAGPAG